VVTRAPQHPALAVMDVPARDGSLLHITLHRDEKTGAFTYDSELEIQEYAAHGLRPLAQYKAGSFVLAPRRPHGFQLHDKNPGLTIGGHWVIAVSDWVEMLTEDSIDLWKVRIG
jgi:hypothetical protein